MKIKQSFGLLALGVALITTASQAQTTPTGAATSTTYPQGAITPDSMSSKASSRGQKRAMKQNRRAMNAQMNANGTTNTSTQDARYRQSSASDGTTNNNSNLTNYNSNNATNAPTGVGSNPNTLSNSTTQSNQTSSQRNMGTTDSNAGTLEAVKGAKMSETPAVKAGSTVRNTSIGDFMASSPNYTTLQNALQSSDLFETLKGTGPYTLFAPDNDAFKKLPTAVQAGLLDGSHREALKQLLSYHVVNGSLTSEDLTRQIKAGNGKAQLKTLSGTILTAKLDANGKLMLTDEQGNTVSVEGADNRQSNGTVYRLTSVLIPKASVAAFR